jgi:hypothetical protein
VLLSEEGGQACAHKRVGRNQPPLEQPDGHEDDSTDEQNSANQEANDEANVGGPVGYLMKPINKHKQETGKQKNQSKP